MKVFSINTVILFCLIVFFINCGGSADEKKLGNLYNDYHKALQQEDIDALKSSITAERQKELLGEGVSFKLEMIKELLPGDIKITKTTISGDNAELETEGKHGNQKMTGKVKFLKEGGQWKIDKEDWQMTIELSGDQPGTGFMGDVQSFMADPKKLPQVQQTLTGHQGEVTNLAFTPDGLYLVSASYGDYSLRVWDPYTGQELSKARTPKRVRSIAVSSDGSFILTADAYNNLMRWPLDQGTIGPVEPLVTGCGDSLALSPKGKYIAITGWKRPVLIWSFDKRQVIEKIGKNPDRRVLFFSPSGTLLVGGGEGNSYSIWDTRKWKEKRYRVNKVTKDSGISSIDISRDETHMATGHSDSSIVIFDFKKRRELHNFYVRDAATRAVKFSPDTKLLATAQQDKKIYLWEVKTARRLAVLAQHSDVPVSLAFSPDGRVLASGGEDRKILIWSSGPPKQPSSVPARTPAPGAAKPEMVEVEGEPNHIKDPDAPRFTRSWKTKGEVSIETEQTEDGDNHLFVIRYSGMIRQDVPVGDSTGRYALLIAWASSERVIESGDQTGRPYLYGYMLNKSDNKKINAYLKDQEMLLSSTTADEWGVIYGIFPVPPGTGAIRFFMQQADGHEPQNGSAARFDEPGVFLFFTEKEAQAFVKKY